MLVPLAVLGLSVVGYSDEEKVAEKKKEPVVDVTKEELTSKATTTSKWFSPTDKKVEWKKANKLCKDNGGRLPTIEELKEVVPDCGGTVVISGDKNWNSILYKNLVNKAYQSCYKNKGFSSSYYWSSSTINGDENHAWRVFFYGGYVNGYATKGHNYYVRCVRDGQ
jgi:hypothetical protein